MMRQQAVCASRPVRPFGFRRLGFAILALAIVSPSHSVQRLHAVPRMPSPCSIRVQARASEGTVSPLLFGENIHWRCAGYTLKDRSQPELGFRPDMLELARNLGVSVLRFPGGRLSETYRWRDGVGPLSLRKGMDDSYGNLETPYFGTDEFMAFAEELGCQEKVITVNFCTGTPQEAANWVEYCNSPAPGSPDPNWRIDSYAGDQKAPPRYFAWLRACFGHPEPYRVNYWEIGNEVYARDDLRPDLTPEEYGQLVMEFARRMKAVDPTVQIGGVVESCRWDNWTDGVLRTAGPALDFVAPHYYSSLGSLAFDTYYRGGTATRSVYFPRTEPCTFTVIARGRLVEDGPPDEEVGVPVHMELSVDGTVVQRWEVDDQLRKYQCAYTVTGGYHEVALAFTNDVWFPETNQGRDLYVYKVARQWASGREESIWYPNDAEQQLLFNDDRMISGRIGELEGKLRRYGLSHVAVAVTEGAVNYPCEGSPEWSGCATEEVRHSLRHKSALWESAFLNTLIREQILMYCHWLLIDPGYYGLIREPVYTAGADLVVTPVYHLLRMYSPLAGSQLVHTDVSSPSFIWPESTPVPPVYDGNDCTWSLDRPEGVSYLDVIACRAADGRSLLVVVTNRHDEPMLTDIRIQGFRVGQTGTVQTLQALSVVPRPDEILSNPEAALEARNETMTLERETIEPDDVRVTTAQVRDVSQRFRYSFPPHSVTVIELPKR